MDNTGKWLHLSPLSLSIWTGAGILFLVIAGLMAYNTINEFKDQPYWITGATDHNVLNNLIYISQHPGTLPRDDIFRDTHYYDFYTPSFIFLTGNLTAQLDSYSAALLVIQVAVTVLYLYLMSGMLWQLTGSRLVGITVSVFSGLLVFNTFNEFWAINSIYFMLPRTVALVGIALSTLFMVRQWQAAARGQDSLLLWFISGLTLGLAALLHPQSGYGLAFGFGIALLMGWWRTGRPGLLAITLLALGTMLGVLPFFQSFSGSSQLPVNFDAVYSLYSVRIERLTVPFFVEDTGRWNNLPGALQIDGFLAWLVVSLVTWFIAGRTKSRIVWGLFVILQMFMMMMMTLSIPPGWTLVITAFILWRVWHHFRSDMPELMMLELAFAFIVMAFGLVIVIQLVMERFHIWSLITLMSQTSRNLRLLAIPFYSLSALALAFAGQHAGPVWQRIQTLLRSYSSWRMLPVFVIGGALAMFAFIRWISFVPFYVPPVFGALTGAVLWARHYRAWTFGRTVSVLAVLVALALVLMRLLRAQVFGLAEMEFIIALALPGFLVVAYAYQRSGGQLREWYLPVYTAILLLMALFYMREVQPEPLQAPVSPLFDVALWAHASTDQDALFYLASTDVYDLTMGGFRLYARRSIANFYWKDLGGLGASDPDGIVTIFQQQQRIAAASATKDGTEQMADELKADYVIVPRDTAWLPLPYEVAYQNTGFVVYKVAAS